MWSLTLEYGVSTFYDLVNVHHFVLTWFIHDEEFFENAWGTVRSY